MGDAVVCTVSLGVLKAGSAPLTQHIYHNAYAEPGSGTERQTPEQMADSLHCVLVCDVLGVFCCYRCRTAWLLVLV